MANTGAASSNPWAQFGYQYQSTATSATPTAGTAAATAYGTAYDAQFQAQWAAFSQLNPGYDYNTYYQWFYSQVPSAYSAAAYSVTPSNIVTSTAPASASVSTLAATTEPLPPWRAEKLGGTAAALNRPVFNPSAAKKQTTIYSAPPAPSTPYSPSAPTTPSAASSFGGANNNNSLNSNRPSTYADAVKGRVPAQAGPIPNAAFYTPKPPPPPFPSLSTQSSSNSAQQKVEPANFPEALKKYVARCYGSIKESDKEAVSFLLKKKIADSIASGDLYLRDWDKEPVPDEAALKQQTVQFSLAGLNKPFESTKPTPGSKVTWTTEEKEFGPAKSRMKAQGAKGDDDEMDFISLSPKGKKRKNRNNKAIENVSDPWSKQKRQKRFEDDQPQRSRPAFVISSRTEAFHPITADDWEDMVVVGTCEKLEKNYYRLTSAPDPAAVRPERVLREAFKHVVTQWTAKEDWEYTQSQMKSIRQDLAVQHIKNEFTVKVYETHAKLCLENGDIGEYNQCQSQLNNLYEMGLPGQEEEFVAYRILYSIYQDDPVYQIAMLKEFKPHILEANAVKHAMKVRTAYVEKNWHAFFKLYKTAPFMGQYVMDFLVDRIRIASLQRITKVVKPTLPVDYLVEEFGFDDIGECLEFLISKFAVFADKAKTELDCKESHEGAVRWEREEREKQRLEKEGE